MTGTKRPKIAIPEEPEPSPMPMPSPEVEGAKKKVRKRAKGHGRETTIFAGRMMKSRKTSEFTSIL